MLHDFHIVVASPKPRTNQGLIQKFWAQGAEIWGFWKSPRTSKICHLLSKTLKNWLNGSQISKRRIDRASKQRPGFRTWGVRVANYDFYGELALLRNVTVLRITAVALGFYWLLVAVVGKKNQWDAHHWTEPAAFGTICVLWGGKHNLTNSCAFHRVYERLWR